MDIHFIRVRSRHENAMPLIITPDWPGSVIELLGVVGPLTDPAAHGGQAEDAFDLVLPSLTGYGFSAEPAEPGWNVGRIARAWAQLMHRLGYTRPGRRRGRRRHRRELGRIEHHIRVGVWSGYNAPGPLAPVRA